MTKLFTGLLQPTLQEGTGSFVSGGPYGTEGEPLPSKCDKTIYTGLEVPTFGEGTNLFLCLWALTGLF